MAGESNVIPNKRQKGRDGKLTASATGQASNWGKVTATYLEDATLAPNEIRYRYLGNSSSSTGKPARPYQQHFTDVPLVGEIVEIIQGPDQSTNGRVLGVDYYKPAINIWNHPHHGAVSKGNTPNVGSRDFEESVDVNPMYPFTGDVLVEGRRGQSLRFSETKLAGISTEITPWYSSQPKSQPIIAIVNGQIKTTQGIEYITEDINQDASSIYLLQQSSIGLNIRQDWIRGNEADNQTTYGTAQVPVTPANYEGNQVIINSGRLILNAKDESIILTSQKAINILSNTLHFDSTAFIHFDSPILRLTGESRNLSKSRRAVRGEDLVEELKGLYEVVEVLSSTLGILAVQLDRVDIKIATKNLQLYVNQLKRNSLSNNLLSKRVFLT